MALGDSITSTFAAGAATFGAVQNIGNVASNLGAAAGSVDSFASAARLAGSGLPAAGEAIGDLVGAVSMFLGDDNASDWRVRLSLPLWISFRTSPVLTPLKDAGGLVFPYTPQISVSSKATYSTITTQQTNFTYKGYNNSDPGNIVITAPFNVEDPSQALYWIAAVHYLRSLTKMFTGSDMKAGNPPPIVHLNGYGNYVFRNVPVVCTDFSMTLPNDCDYIGVNVVGSALGGAAGFADSLGGLADSLGGALPGLSPILDGVSAISGVAGQVAGTLGALGVGGSTSGGVTHVPTKSQLRVTLTPVYSRDTTRKFSLDRFVTGGYLNSIVGYV